MLPSFLSPVWRARPSLSDLWQARHFIAFSTLTSMAGVIFINDNIFETGSITGRSMAPTLSPEYNETGHKDSLLWNKWRAVNELKRGDIVHFMSPNKPEEFAVKRVIALEGDVVILDKKRRPWLADKPEPPDARAWDAWNGKVKVPQGHIWVEGDNFRKSRDSNWYGPISKSLVNGTATAVVWPPKRFWMKPWLDYESRTKVIEGRVEKKWTEGLPVELAEVGEPHIR